MSTVQFKEVVSADKAANTKANGLWGKMALYVHQTCAGFTLNAEGKPKAHADFLQNREKETREQDSKWKPSNAYRSNKSLILRAVRLSVALTTKAGEARGKTEVQDQCNEIERKDLSPYDQFMAAINTVGKKLDKLEQGQRTSAMAAISALQERVRKMVTGEQEKMAA